MVDRRLSENRKINEVSDRLLVGHWVSWVVDSVRCREDRRCRDTIYRVRIMRDGKNLKKKLQITYYKMQKKE